MKVMVSCYGYDRELIESIEIVDKLEQNNVTTKVLAIKEDNLDDKRIEYLLNHKEYQEKYKEFFYYFYSDRFIYDMSGLKGYTSTNFSIELIWRSFFRLVSFLETNLEEFNPDVVYLFNGPDNYLTNVLAKICETKDIPYFWLNHEYFSSKYIFFANAFTYTNRLFQTYQENDFGKFKKDDFLIDVIQENKEIFTRYTSNNIVNLIRKNISFFKKSKEVYDISLEDRIFYPWINEPILNMKNKFIKTYNFISNKLYANSFVSLEELKTLKLGKNFLLFPLHEQPEAATLAMQPLFNEQYYFIKLISDALPPNWILLVKEYPIETQNLGLRDPNFYKKIKDLKNVKLIKFDVSMSDLMDNNLIDKLITVGNSTGFEFMLNLNPPMVFSNVYYSNFKYIQKIEYLEYNSLMKQLNIFLQSDIEDIEEYEEELEKFLGAYKNSLLEDDKASSVLKIIQKKEFYF